MDSSSRSRLDGWKFAGILVAGPADHINVQALHLGKLQEMRNLCDRKRGKSKI